MQLSGRNALGSSRLPARLADLRPGEAGVLDAIDLPEDDARRLMELGFLPGSLVTAARRSPFGDPRLFRVDGSEIAIRRETAQHLTLRPQNGTHASGTQAHGARANGANGAHANATQTNGA